MSGAFLPHGTPEMKAYETVQIQSMMLMASLPIPSVSIFWTGALATRATYIGIGMTGIDDFLSDNPLGLAGVTMGFGTMQRLRPYNNPTRVNNFIGWKVATTTIMMEPH